MKNTMEVNTAMLKAPGSRKATSGRPKLLTRQQVIDAALQLGKESQFGVDSFTMKTVAAKLGVSVPTIYQYVRDRDELLRLVIAHLLESLPYPADTGQHWASFLREYARATHDLLTLDSKILARFMEGGFILETELQVAENFLQIMVPRGFIPVEAVHILNRIVAAACGAAVATCRERATVERFGSLEQALHNALSHYPPDGLPLLGQTGASILNSEDQLTLMIEPIIYQIAANRGESV